MIEKIKKLNDALPGMLAGIAIWGALWQVAGVWFVKDKAGCSLGLWIGIITAAGMAVHMAWALNRAVEFSEKDASVVMTKYNLLRYGAVLIVEGILMMTEVANPLTAFLGIMGLKVAAYLQPITHKLFRR